MRFLSGSVNHGQMTIFILRPSRNRARIGLFDRRGVLPIGDEAIPHIRRELSGLSLIPVDLPLVLPIRDSVAKAGLCLCNEFPLHPLIDSQRPMPLLLKHKNFEKITINNKYLKIKSNI